GHQLHADAYAKKRFAVLAHAVLKRVDHAGDLIEPAPAVGESAHTGQDDTVGTRDFVRPAGHDDRLIMAALARSPFECFRGRMQIARTIIDDNNAHRCPPGSGNKPITSDPEGGPHRIGEDYFGSEAAEGCAEPLFICWPQ